MLTTENATLSEVVGPERIVILPLDGRNYAQLALLTPGVKCCRSTGFGPRSGARDINKQLSIDGINAVNNRRTFVVVYSSRHSGVQSAQRHYSARVWW
jgi:hypothetical protein